MKKKETESAFGTLCANVLMTSLTEIQMKGLRPIHCLLGFLIMITACGESEPREADLPKQPDRWVNSVPVAVDSRVQYIGKTRDYVVTSISASRDIGARQTISLGDEIEGIRVGAIQCSFHWRDATYGSAQYMWRGRWACKAGRNRQEVANAVDSQGKKRFDYIHLSPVTLGSR